MVPNKRKHKDNSNAISWEKQVANTPHIMTLMPYVGKLPFCNLCHYHHINRCI